MLVYGRQIGALVRRLMPPGDGTPSDDYPRLVQQAVFGYVRGQLIFSLVMGGSATLMLYVFGWLGIFPAGTNYAAFFGAFYGLMEFIPYVGPIIGPIPALLVALFENPLSAVWLLIGFIALQQLEGHVDLAAGVRPRAADQPDRDHRGAADRRRVVRDHRLVGRAAGRGGDPPDRRISPRPHDTGVVGRTADGAQRGLKRSTGARADRRCGVAAAVRRAADRAAGPGVARRWPSAISPRVADLRGPPTSHRDAAPRRVDCFSVGR